MSFYILYYAISRDFGRIARDNNYYIALCSFFFVVQYLYLYFVIFARFNYCICVM